VLLHYFVNVTDCSKLSQRVSIGVTWKLLTADLLVEEMDLCEEDRLLIKVMELKTDETSNKNGK